MSLVPAAALQDRPSTFLSTAGRLQVMRLYELTTGSGVRDMLSFLIVRDTMHQNQQRITRRVRADVAVRGSG